MNVLLCTNRPAYLNDIADEIRMFFGVADVTLTDEAGLRRSNSDTLHVSVHIRREKNDWVVEAWAALHGDTVSGQRRTAAREDTPLLRKRYEKRAMKIAVFRLMRDLTGLNMPWGSLTGIRPTKLWRELLRAEGEKEALRLMRDDFEVSPAKIELLQKIHEEQAPFLVENAAEKNVSVYVGIPYCKTRCLYCSFGSRTAPRDAQLDIYLDGLLQDISLGEQIVHAGGYRVRSVYIGGGTPTILSADRLNKLLGHIRACYPEWTGEFTVEAGRPDSVDAEKLTVMRRAGVNRISINPQSMNDETLERIGRRHTAADVEKAFYLAREHGFSNINMDVIVGLPGETRDDFHNTLKRIETLSPDSLTVHTLAIKRSSFLKEHLDAFAMISAQEAEETVALGAAYAERMGMRPYYMYRQKYMRGNLENVGYARPHCACVYNIDMMEENVSVMAHGAGAITKRVFGAENRVERVPSPKDVDTYLVKFGELSERKRMLFT